MLYFHLKKKMSQRKLVGVKGKVIHRQGRQIVHNVMQFMQNEAENGPSIPIVNYG